MLKSFKENIAEQGSESSDDIHTTLRSIMTNTARSDIEYYDSRKEKIAVLVKAGEDPNKRFRYPSHLHAFTFGGKQPPGPKVFGEMYDDIRLMLQDLERDKLPPAVRDLQTKMAEDDADFFKQA